MTTKSDDSASVETDQTEGFRGSFRDSINKRFKNFRSTSNGSSLNSSDTKPQDQKPSEVAELPPLTPVELTGYKPDTKNRLMTCELAEDIRNLIGSRLQLYSEWKLLYSLEQHGAALSTLYSRCSPDFGRTSNNIYSMNQSYAYSATHLNDYLGKHVKRLGYVLVVKDFQNNIFGAYSNEHFHPSLDKLFYGNGECFLWKCKKNNPVFTINTTSDNKIQRTLSRSGTLDESAPEFYEHHVQFMAYPYTGINAFIIHCTKDFLSMGAGEGHYGLWLDNELMEGISYQSLTFGNEPLSDSGPKFKVQNVEVWKVGGD